MHCLGGLPTYDSILCVRYVYQASLMSLNVQSFNFNLQSLHFKSLLSYLRPISGLKTNRCEQEDRAKISMVLSMQLALSMFLGKKWARSPSSTNIPRILENFLGKREQGGGSEGALSTAKSRHLAQFRKSGSNFLFIMIHSMTNYGRFRASNQKHLVFANYCNYYCKSRLQSSAVHQMYFQILLT